MSSLFLVSLIVRNTANTVDSADTGDIADTPETMQERCNVQCQYSNQIGDQGQSVAKF